MAMRAVMQPLGARTAWRCAVRVAVLVPVLVRRGATRAPLRPQRGGLCRRPRGPLQEQARPAARGFATAAALGKQSGLWERTLGPLLRLFAFWRPEPPPTERLQAQFEELEHHRRNCKLLHSWETYEQSLPTRGRDTPGATPLVFHKLPGWRDPKPLDYILKQHRAAPALVKYKCGPPASGKTLSILPTYLAHKPGEFTHYLFAAFHDTDEARAHFKARLRVPIRLKHHKAASQGASFMLAVVRRLLANDYSPGHNEVKFRKRPRFKVRHATREIDKLFASALGKDAQILFHLDESWQMCEHSDSNRLHAGAAFCYGAHTALARARGVTVVSTFVEPGTEADHTRAPGGRGSAGQPMPVPIDDPLELAESIPELAFPPQPDPRPDPSPPQANPMTPPMTLERLRLASIGLCSEPPEQPGPQPSGDGLRSRRERLEASLRFVFALVAVQEASRLQLLRRKAASASILTFKWKHKLLKKDEGLARCVAFIREFYEASNGPDQGASHSTQLAMCIHACKRILEVPAVAQVEDRGAADLLLGVSGKTLDADAARDGPVVVLRDGRITGSLMHRLLPAYDPEIPVYEQGARRMAHALQQSTPRDARPGTLRRTADLLGGASLEEAYAWALSVRSARDGGLAIGRRYPIRCTAIESARLYQPYVYSAEVGTILALRKGVLYCADEPSRPNMAGTPSPCSHPNGDLFFISDNNELVVIDVTAAGDFGVSRKTPRLESAVVALRAALKDTALTVDGIILCPYASNGLAGTATVHVASGDEARDLLGGMDQLFSALRDS